MAGQYSNVIAALDVGTTKTCCLIARVGDEGLKVIGAGHQLSQGMKGGSVVDMEAVETSIRAAVDGAERMAGATIDEVFVATSGGRPASRMVEVEVSIAGHEVDEYDLTQALDDGRDCPSLGDGEIIHAMPVSYAIDGERGIRDPRGMVGERLGVSVHVVAAQPGPLRNLKTCIQRGHLDVAEFVLAPHAAGIASLVEDEMELGVTLLDMGGRITSIAAYQHGRLIHTDAVSVGGDHVTNDLARGLLISKVQAERIKTLHGNALASPSDDRTMIAIQPMGESEDDASQVSRSMLARVIQPRLEETFELVRDRLRACAMDRIAGRRLVLTGGASQLHGTRELAGRVLGKQVRVARPSRLRGLPESMNGPAFAVCAGVLQYAADRPREMRRIRQAMLAHQVMGGRFAGIGRWLKENF
jgi:cell division protein FtsA